jgi:hypothetical protein
MNVAIALGTYRFTDFVRLNLLQLQRIWPDSPILISDDKSDQSDDIKKLAEEFGCAFSGSTIRRGHFAGDIQSAVNGLSFAEQVGADIMLKLSQRLIPVLPKFREFIEQPFEDQRIRIVVPGRISSSQIRLPQSKFFSGMGILTDVYAIRVGSISPQQFLNNYLDGMKFGRFASALLVECSIGKLLASHFNGSSYISMDLANHKPSEPMAFLRKAQADPNAYQMIASLHGLTGGNYDTREIGAIEGRGYLCRPVLQ